VNLQPETGGAGEFDHLIEQAYRELEKARRIASSIIANARNEASEMIARAKTVSARMAREAAEQENRAREVRVEEQREQARKAYQEGFDEGLGKGAEEGRSRFEAIATKLGGILDHIQGEREKMFGSYRQEIVELVLQIAERVVRVERDTVASLLGENLRLLLEDCASKDETVLHLNPADLENVSRYLVDKGGALPRHRLKTDPAVPPGECRVRSKSLNLDLSFAKRFEAIRDRLRAKFALRSGRS